MNCYCSNTSEEFDGASDRGLKNTDRINCLICLESFSVKMDSEI